MKEIITSFSIILVIIFTLVGCSTYTLDTSKIFMPENLQQVGITYYNIVENAVLELTSIEKANGKLTLKFNVTSTDSVVNITQENFRCVPYFDDGKAREDCNISYDGNELIVECDITGYDGYVSICFPIVGLNENDYNDLIFGYLLWFEN